MKIAPGSRHLFVGPAGWSYADWAGIVYPSKKARGFHEAAYLAEYFDTIEINTSFYQPLKPEHCRQWLERVAANPRFLFTAKLWQKFTHDIGRSLKPSQVMTATVGYVRLHGRRYDTWFSDDPETPASERYNYLYSESELEPWVDRIRKVNEQRGATFVITNNHFQGKGIVNALQLIHLLTGSKVKVPEPLRHRYPELEKIASEPSKEPTLFGS